MEHYKHKEIRQNEEFSLLNVVVPLKMNVKVVFSSFLFIIYRRKENNILENARVSYLT